ncbi:transcriptional regulator [bacterium]|nr:MAG: transcriptional regulator [bacterium]
MPNAPICQSCAMPMQKDEDFGANTDGSKNSEYCCYCYQKGAFTKPDMTKDQMISLLAGMADKIGMTADQAKEMAEKVLPTLKRWQ